YNILSRWPGTDAEFLAWTRAEALMGALSGDDKLRAVGQTVVQKVFHLLSEPDIQESALRVTDFLRDAQLRRRILAKCRNRSLAGYFAGEFQNILVPRSERCGGGSTRLRRRRASALRYPDRRAWISARFKMT